MTVLPYLAVSACLFGIGLYGLMSSRNFIKMLLSAEVIFNGGLLALLSMAAASGAAPVGGAIAILAIAIAAAEVGVAVSIAILMFMLKGDVDVYKLEKFKG